MRFRKALRRKRIVVPLVAAMGVALGAGIAFAGGAPDTYTGCLTKGGTINKVAAGDDPKSPCTGNSTQISLASAGAVDALAARVQALEDASGGAADPGLYATITSLSTANTAAIRGAASNGAVSVANPTRGNFFVAFDRSIVDCVATVQPGGHFGVVGAAAASSMTATVRVGLGWDGASVAADPNSLQVLAWNNNATAFRNMGFMVDLDC